MARDNPVLDYTGTGPLTVGAWNGSPFGGSLDNVRIWGDARSAEEIAANYQLTTPTSTDNLLANWTMDQITNGVVVDASGSGNHLVLGATISAESSDPTLANPPARALAFDGTDDSVSIANAAA